MFCSTRITLFEFVGSRQFWRFPTFGPGSFWRIFLNLDYFARMGNVSCPALARTLATGKQEAHLSLLFSPPALHSRWLCRWPDSKHMLRLRILPNTPALFLSRFSSEQSLSFLLSVRRISTSGPSPALKHSRGCRFRPLDDKAHLSVHSLDATDCNFPPSRNASGTVYCYFQCARIPLWGIYHPAPVELPAAEVDQSRIKLAKLQKRLFP